MTEDFDHLKQIDAHPGLASAIAVAGLRRVLITNLSMNALGGSQIVALDLASSFRSAGGRVVG